MGNKARIIIVDDNCYFREGMKLLIEMEGIGVVIAEAENGKEFLDLLVKLQPDLVLMDMEMPMMGGIEATRRALAMRPELKILAVTMFNDTANYTGMLDAGAKGLVIKSAGITGLKNAIKTTIDLSS
ncbi:MAG: response regulator transcription factor [Lentimicrobiaceae bacterium]|jgi:DNA-binding NarL/FixJ family response regulator